MHDINWLANVIVVPKKEEKWKVCIIFIDLNKACPKYGFSLLRIYYIIDATLGHGILSFMKAFFYYNQISMYLPDLDKITIIIPQGLYYYNVMSFGLKSVKATYQ